MGDTSKIDEAWSQLMHGRAGWWSDDPIFRAAYEDRVLRTLFPFPTHGTLRFFRTVPPPWPAGHADHLPFIVCGSPPHKIYTAGYGRLLGEANTPQEAVALLVAVLPDPGDPDPSH